MKITNQILSLPPYLSTSWRDVQSLHQEGNLLVVSLLNGEIVRIPSLSAETITQIFEAHATFLEQQQRDERMDVSQRLSSLGAVPLENLGSLMQHNPAQAGLPDLPPEMLNKISSIAKAIAPEDADQLPKAEPHCNCPHCQIARAINGSAAPEPEVVDDVVDESDLAFQQWDVTQSGDQLFSVVNRLDPNERYSVFLGQPIGCTCGRSHCEHLVAVLQS